MEQTQNNKQLCELPRVMFAAVGSGSGKTLLTCGIMQALLERGLRLASFKCGPDYIDPMFHSRVVGTQSRNLDTWFTGEELTRYLLARGSRGAELAVMEGVMGFYDGVGQTTRASSYDLARVTQTPVVLVLGGRGMSLSMAATLQGFQRFRPDSNIQGVILNQVSRRTYELIAPVIEQECGLSVLGYVPTQTELVLESRHLGLVTPEEVAGLKEKLSGLAAVLRDCLDLDRLLELARSAPAFSYEKPQLPRLEQPVRLGVARDAAFCFYYEDNLELLRELGAELIPFSPLCDELPPGLQAVLFGGGYPELYARQLSENTVLRAQIREALASGLPCLAECGGFMYLHDEMEDMEGNTYPMVGAISGRAYRTTKLGRFGYIKLTAKKAQALGEAGLQLRGHEFHYFDSTNCGAAFAARKPTGVSWECLHGTDTMVAGFPHLYYYSNPMAAYRFLQAGARYGKEREKCY